MIMQYIGELLLAWVLILSTTFVVVKSRNDYVMAEASKDQVAQITRANLYLSEISVELNNINSNYVNQNINEHN